MKFEKLSVVAKRRLINTFIVFNIAAVTFGSGSVVPKITEARAFFEPYLKWTRLAQDWFLFPDPKRKAMKFRVDLEFQDKSKTSWVRPYPPNWDFFERHLAYNFQKLDLAGTWLLRGPTIQRDFCTYVMKLHLNADNPPVKVSLVLSEANWLPPTEYLISYDESKLFWNDKVIAAFLVKDETILERMGDE